MHANLLLVPPPTPHTQVRGVCACDLGIVTSSRDKTAKIWAQDGAAAGGGAAGCFAPVQTLVGHTNYVTAVAYIPPGARPDLPNGAVVTGSLDLTVRVWDPVSGAGLAVLQGHEQQVTALAVLAGGDVASASIDK